ncbi:hypothetical protein SFC41_02595 [Weissella cibaria]|uniref:hypothetical protein n=1 Tax=Weissella cibaria TaxID=137591 RepID=UPI0039832E97
MVKKVVDVPDNADYITAHEQINAGGSFLLQKYNVADLPDAPTVAESAPKKRVIELPADLLEKLTVEQENASGLLGFFDMDGHSVEIMNWLGEFLPEPDNLEPENIAADWYLDHIEFVPKKEPKYLYMLRGFYNQYITKDTSGRLYLGILSVGRVFEYQSFTHDEIEKLASEKGFKLSAFEEIKVEE